MVLRIKDIIDSAKGISGVSGVLSKYIDNINTKGHTSNEPGDYVRRTDDANVVVAAPIAYDLWYLFNKPEQAVNLISLFDFDNASYISEQLGNITSKIENLKTFRGILDPSALIAAEARLPMDMSEQETWRNTAEYFIHLLGYESWYKGDGFQFASPGPKNINDCVGYITLPAGQLGVMEIISLLLESEVEKTSFEVEEEQKPVFDQPAQMFPPTQGVWNNVCLGRHIIEQAYVYAAEQETYMEIPAYSISPIYYGADVSPKGWYRYWISKTDTSFIPGCFVMILCKPLALPPHVWWFQESLPFIYAGHWYETNNLSSGVIVSITAEKDRIDQGIGKQYLIKVQGTQIYLDASDFYEYKVGDRVGLYKTLSAYDYWDAEGWHIPNKKSFTFNNFTPIKTAEVMQPSMKYTIIPIDFYKSEE
jgi:hypothetical protein